MPDNAVLVVTDDPHVREAAEHGFGAETLVHVVSDAREAISWMRDGVPDAVVIDIQTGSAGGFALCREMQHDPELTAIPVTMLLEREQDVWLARQAGAGTYRLKPLDAGDLAQVVGDSLAAS